MLFAVEGGFFFSSVSGYREGLAILLLGKPKEERPMRVLPWNRYQLVQQDIDLELPLASKKNRSRGCPSFICFGRPSVGLEGPSPLKVEPVHQQDISSASDGVGLSSLEKNEVNCEHGNDRTGRKLFLKSSLKKPKKPTDCSVVVREADVQGASDEQGNVLSGCTERRKVQWTDACGRELVEIREFEPRVKEVCHCLKRILELCFHRRDTEASDDEFDTERERRCVCVIQ